ncbi:hypothetical protein V6N13_004267 [Hibiscus sabdariffa]
MGFVGYCFGCRWKTLQVDVKITRRASKHEGVAIHATGMAWKTGCSLEESEEVPMAIANERGRELAAIRVKGKLTVISGASVCKEGRITVNAPATSTTSGDRDTIVACWKDCNGEFVLGMTRMAVQ